MLRCQVLIASLIGEVAHGPVNRHPRGLGQIAVACLPHANATYQSMGPHRLLGLCGGLTIVNRIDPGDLRTAKLFLVIRVFRVDHG